MSKEQKKKLCIIGGIVAAVVLIIIAVMTASSGDRKRDALLELGDKYLSEMDYEAAVATYDEAITIDPKCEAAYIGKATAQYKLGLYEDAMETLKQGINQIGESSALTELLQKIQDEFNNQTPEEIEQKNLEAQIEKVVAGENFSSFMLLNYSSIIRRSDTQDKQIQLEVIADEGAKNGEITWTSQNPEVATVSEDGLVTLTGEEGWGEIAAVSGTRSTVCDIRVGDSLSDADTIYLSASNTEGKGRETYFSAELSKEDAGDEVSIINNNYGSYVYYSGDVIIPENLKYQGNEKHITKISPYALYWCNTMETVKIPASVESFKGEGDYRTNPFFFCTSLEEILLDEENEYFKTVDGVLYSSDGKELISYPAAREGRSYTIPKEVEVIYEGAFFGCKNLEEILVEEGNQRYESIDGVLIDNESGYYANCTLIAYPCGRTQKEYAMPEKIEAVGGYVFSGPALEKVICGANVKILNGSFWNCEHLKSIEGMEQVEQINDYLFKGCDQLEKIGGGVGTKTIFLSSVENVREIEIEGLPEMQNLETLDLYGIKLKNVEDIYGLVALQSLGIAGTENEIDVNALQNLEGLRRINLTDLKKVNDLSWLKEMNGLESLSLQMEEFAITDLEVLEQLENLRQVHIDASSTADLSETSLEKIRQQIASLKENNPDCSFSILGIE